MLWTGLQMRMGNFYKMSIYTLSLLLSTKLVMKLTVKYSYGVSAQTYNTILYNLFSLFLLQETIIFFTGLKF